MILRKAGYHSVWSLACQDHVAGIRIVSLGGALLCLFHLLSLLSLKGVFSGWDVF